MAVVKNGTSIFNIKEDLINQIAPNYFDNIKNLNELNVGLYGYTTEILANTAKDSYNSVASLFKEMFITQAELPESIYEHALLFQLSNIFATPARVPFTIIISEDAVVNASTASSDYMYFDIDSNAEFTIDGMVYMLDYDVRIMTKKTSTGYVHAAQYIMDRTNSISSLLNPYITTSILYNDNQKRYIELGVVLHQVQKKTIQDTILNNDILNLVTLNYTFDDSLANFEIFYQAPGEAGYVQLKKRLYNTDKLSEPFCYYKLVDDNKLEITFPNDEKYFQPAYNSNIMVELYTTKGSEGNFDTYEGSDVNVIGKADKYESNRGIIFIGSVTGSSYGGTDRSTIDELKNETMKSYATIKSFTTSSDLNIYFEDVVHKYVNSRICFMKKRDDAFERLYGSFILFKDNDKNIVPTNTLDMRLYAKDISTSIAQTHRNVIPAGLLYEYVPTSDPSIQPYVKVCDDATMQDDLDQYEKSKFLYVNPFLTIVGTDPLSVGFYLNTVEDILPVAHINLPIITIYQFIIDNIKVSRNSLVGEDEYTFTVDLAPTASLPEEPMQLIREDTEVKPTDRVFHNEYDNYDYIDKGLLRLVIELLDSAGTPHLYLELEFIGFDKYAYKFKGSLKTNDYISIGHAIQITDGFKHVDTYDEQGDPVLIPATHCVGNIYAFYKNPELDPADIPTNPFQRFETFNGFTMTNQYQITKDNPINFVRAIDEIRSNVEYVMREDDGKYGFKLNAVPLVKANYLKLEGKRDAFVKNFKQVYEYIQDANERLTNNFHIDMKFFNTYGNSLHYYIANMVNTHIDKINMSLNIDVKWEVAANEEAQNQELIEFTKKFIEDVDINNQTSPNFYFSSLIHAAKEKFSKLKYMVIQGINDYSAEIQVLESDVNESNIIQGVIETSDVVPEFLNIEMIIKEGIQTPQIHIRNIH